MTRRRRAQRAHRARPGRQAFLDDHRIDGTPVLPGVMGIEGFAEAAARAAARTGTWPPSRTSSCWRRSSSTATSRARSSCGRCCATAATATLVADCRAGRPPRRSPARSEQETVHFTGRVRLARERRPQPPADASARRRAPSGAVVEHDAVYRVYFHGPAYQVLDRAWRERRRRRRPARRDLPPDHEPPGQPIEIGAAADRAVLPDRRRVGARHGRADGAADPRRPRRRASPARTTPGRCGRSSARATDGDGVDAEVVDERGRVRVRLEGYRTIELPGGARRRRARADPRGDGLAGRARPCSDRSTAWRSSTAASRRCGSSTPCAS